MLRCHSSVMSKCYLQGLGHGVHPYAKNLLLTYFPVRLEQLVKGQKVEKQYEMRGMEGCHCHLSG